MHHLLLSIYICQITIFVSLGFFFFCGNWNFVSSDDVCFTDSTLLSCFMNQEGNISFHFIIVVIWEKHSFSFFKFHSLWIIKYVKLSMDLLLTLFLSGDRSTSLLFQDYGRAALSWNVMTSKLQLHEKLK